MPGVSYKSSLREQPQILSRNIIIIACILAKKLKFSGNKNMGKSSILTSKISPLYHSNLHSEVKHEKLLL